MKKGFTLIELLVVIGIIGIIIAVATGAYGKMTASAERARCQELVSNVATSLAAYFNDTGAWPKALLDNGGVSDGRLDERAAYPLAKRGYMTLTVDGGRLSGYDKFGLVTPWATSVIKARGASASLSDRVRGGGTIEDHVLHYALDADGDGIIPNASVGGESIPIRATVAVWCCGKDGKLERYSRGLKTDDVYSWTYGQTRDVK